VAGKGVEIRAYKVLNDGRSAFTGWAWPLPSGETPGEWVQATGQIGLCVNGIHASNTAQLPQWLGDEIWEVELDGEILRVDPALVATRARLIRRVQEWNEPARMAFCEDCAHRARGIATRSGAGTEIYEEKIAPFTVRGMAAAVGYWTALLTGEAATGQRAGTEYDVAFAAERDAQAVWLRRELDLRD
jgi:hypothetical protein